MVIGIGAGVMKANKPKILRKFGESLELTKGWSQNVLKNMDWVKRKVTTGKVEPRAKFLQEQKLSFQRAISKFVSEHDIPLQSWTRYLRQVLVFRWNTALRETFNFYFSAVFC